MPLSLTRSHLQPMHDLTQEQLAAHPDQLGRILYFVLPFLFAAITSIALYNRNLRVHQNNFVRVLPSSFYYLITFLIALIGVAAVGIYAVLEDAFTVKEWLLFSIVCVLVGLKALIYTADTNATLFITTIITIVAALPNEWLFAELRDMKEVSQGDIAWKHITRNVFGFVQALLIFFAVVYLAETFVHVLKFFQKGASVLFWVVAPLAIVGVLVLNILAYGPFLDQIGYIVAAVLLFLGAAVHTLFHKEGDRESIPLKN